MAMERGSDKHGRRLDEEIKHETSGLIRGGGVGHAEEWREPEPVRDAEQDMRAHGYPPGHEPGVAPGMTQSDVDQRSNLARWLTDVHYPAGREEILARAESNLAMPDSVRETLRRLPDGEFRNIGEMAEALGLGREHRFGE
ncbi:hypothetical protein Sme01_19600 [Sphaerisporangium melleum]|uniref:DUF2795 domain-containing protein n=1 Tax=Sphaerisporangium melleum TaxID=321316 RepID=A0A917VPZ8_9ACTN|nr:DUF2795 domain-containing protein [Sphaerisporangium melleum]GGL02740.1 hypothetical protein GCM10007964_51030 [Sphaerisporangium melleum]GII69484.1 hypothetical protein Sme01_19600 [Sphaerisporangium melleum]